MLIQVDIILTPNTYLNLFKMLLTCSGITWHIFPSIRSCCIYLIYIQKKVHCRTLIGVLGVYDIPPEILHPILPHDERIQLFHIHLYQVEFRLYWPCIYVIDEKELILWFSISLLSCLSALLSPCMSLLGLLCGTNITSSCYW